MHNHGISASSWTVFRTSIPCVVSPVDRVIRSLADSLARHGSQVYNPGKLSPVSKPNFQHVAAFSGYFAIYKIYIDSHVLSLPVVTDEPVA